MEESTPDRHSRQSNSRVAAGSEPTLRNVQGARLRWSDRAARQQRSLTATSKTATNVRAATESIEQILDVLIDNALTHGSGRARVTTRKLAGGAAVDVADEGTSIVEGSDDDIFRRGVGRDNGIGLALARSIAEAEGDRLLLMRRQPTTFSLILLDSDG